MAASGLFARKSLEEALAETEKGGFRRALGALDLTSLGVAAIIGSGIFFLLGNEARTTGPAVTMSLVVGGVAAVLSAFTFAELASLLPGSGSAYTYVYTALGQLPAFFIGWIILNAYAVGNMTVAIGWSSYFTAGTRTAGWDLPSSLTASPPDGILNLPALVLVALVTLLTLPKIRESTVVNNLLVGLKFLIVLFIIAFGFFLIRPGNYVPFNPGGFSGVTGSAAILFFAYLGYDTVAATAEEAKNPRRDLPLGIILSIAVSTVLYVLMAIVVTGMTATADMPDDRPPVAAGFQDRGYGWAFGLITVGALVGQATVIFAFHTALVRILHAMARDGFLPKRFAKLHRSTGTPWALTLWVGGLTALGAGLIPLNRVADMTVLASIVMYVLVAAGVLVLKVLRPEAPRRFSTHWSVAVAAILVLGAIAVLGIGPEIHLFLLAWMGLGLMVYGFYAHRRAEAARHERTRRSTPA